MKILHIITSLYDGGAEGVLYRLCCNDKFNKHIVVSLRDKGKYGQLFLNNNIKIYCLEMKPRRFSIFSLLKLIKILKFEKADIVQTWLYHSDFFGSIAAKLAGVKNLIWNIRHSDFNYDDTKKSLIILVKILAKLSYILPRKIIFCSKNAIKIHEKLGYDKKKLIYIANGYDLKKFRPSINQKLIFRKKFNINKNLPILGNVARFQPHKDHKNLLKALYLLKKDQVLFKCFLVGFKINKQNKILNKLIKKFKLRREIIFLGPQNNINKFMNGIDVHILASKYGEGFPNVVGEAMASGTPCVVTNVGDTREIVKKTGWVVPPNNSIKLSKGIKAALENYETNNWNNLCINARKRIKYNFSINNMIENYRKVWKSNLSSCDTN